MTTIIDTETDAVIDTDGDAKIVRARRVQVVQCTHLDARGAKIASYLDVHRATIGGDLDARGAKIASYLDVHRATIGGDLDARGAKIASYLDVHRAKIGGDLDASDAKIGGDIDARVATIAGGIAVRGAMIGGSIAVRGAMIGGGINAIDAAIGGGIDAMGAAIGGGIDAMGATVNGIAVRPPTEAEIAILRRIRDEIDLDMSHWHGDGDDWCAAHAGHCGTTHCLAGGAQALSDDPAIRAMHPLGAGRRLIPCAAHLFYAPTELVRRWLDRVCAE